MTKREREITDPEMILDFLSRGQIIHLGLCDGDQPYVVPMNYGFTMEDGELTFYVHGAVKGYKYEVLAKNPKVSFSIECDVNPFSGKTACQYGTSYSSVLGKGIAKIVENPQEKMRALTILMKTQTGRDFEFNEKLVSIVNVIEIKVSAYSAKQRPFPEGMKKEQGN
ncbi:MAG: pyridoxamine 5'-phosphate oxidase family protein [Hespellia sp.]|nr:pyridoxamine 5'-phosphate oxidase family protein [Hespellia sp.]